MNNELSLQIEFAIFDVFLQFWLIKIKYIRLAITNDRDSERQIQENRVDHYDFLINWDYESKRDFYFAQISIHPPFTNYQICDSEWKSSTKKNVTNILRSIFCFSPVVFLLLYLVLVNSAYQPVCISFGGQVCKHVQRKKEHRVSPHFSVRQHIARN